MFDRFAAASRRAIYWARTVAIHSNANHIDSEHVLRGLLVESESRANRLLHLQEHLSSELALLKGLTPVPPLDKELPLSDDAKRILAYTVSEAARLNDYWIDTEHLVLGILREQTSDAAFSLRAAGLEVENVRKIIAQNKASRPDYGPEPLSWRRLAWLHKLIARILYLNGC
jgi:ATP-dependent Clp protease ATP-binding subunit ClpC